VPSAEAGVVRADRLDGGLGYLQVVGFPEPALFKPALDRAMRALVGSKALIIDVRQNFGGDPKGAAYLASYLMPPGKRVHLNTFVSREPFSVDYKREDFFSSRTPVRFATQPVYVLVSKRTFSGGEEFAYDMQALIRGTLIGETTAGAANPTGPVPLGEDMTASIPWGRAENPITLSNWEHKGVEPDIPVPAEDALAVVFARFGLPPARDIDAVSRGRVFAPRTAPAPGAEVALRRLIQGFASGSPPYWAMTPDYATFVRQNLAQSRALAARMGRLRTLEFDEAGMWGGDIYLATFERGQQLVSIALAPNGKIAGGEIIGPPTAAAPAP
jgi:hypothetical protein